MQSSFSTVIENTSYLISMGVFCQILINKPRGGRHKAGKPITGIARYTVDEAGRYKDIVISLIGRGKCEWQERRGKRTINYSGKEVYTSQDLSIAHKNGPDGSFILPIGTFEQPFTFVLPYNIPSSLKNNTCTITYKNVLKFEKPSFSSICKKFETEIYVIGNVSPIAPEGIALIEIEKTLFTPFKKIKHRINLQIEIPNTIFKPGEQVQINYKVTNDTDIIIPSLKAELICRKIYTADCGKKKKRTKSVDICTVETPSIPDNAIANLLSMISIADFLYTIQNSKIMVNEYRIQITLRLPIPYINASAMIPVVIGETNLDWNVPESDEFQEEPPSYFEVMNECKEDKEND